MPLALRIFGFTFSGGSSRVDEVDAPNVVVPLP